MAGERVNLRFKMANLELFLSKLRALKHIDFSFLLLVPLHELQEPTLQLNRFFFLSVISASWWLLMRNER